MRVYNPLHQDFGPDEPQGQSRLKCERYRLIYLALNILNSGRENPWRQKQRQKSEHWASGSRRLESLEVLRAGTRLYAFLLRVAIALSQCEAGELEIALAKTPDDRKGYCSITRELGNLSLYKDMLRRCSICLRPCVVIANLQATP